MFCAGFGPGISNCICVNEGPVPETEGTAIGTTSEPVARVGDRRVIGGSAGRGAPAAAVEGGGVTNGAFGFTIRGLGIVATGAESGGASSWPLGFTISGLGIVATGAESGGASSWP